MAQDEDPRDALLGEAEADPGLGQLAAAQVRWLVTDVLTWQPKRRYHAWHDRAVFHFLTESHERRQYLQALESASAAGAVAVFGCFALDGPEYCSDLATVRYGPGEVAAQLGTSWSLIAADREVHLTPAGMTQPFTWAAFRRER